MVPMTNKVILGVTLSALLEASVVGMAAAVPDWLGVVPASGGVLDKNTKTKQLTLTTTDAVDRKTIALAGFGWIYDEAVIPLDDDIVDAFGITTHNLDLDGDGKNDVVDSLQNKNGWHAHNFKFGLVSISSSTHLCVKEITDASTAGISFDADTKLAKVNVQNSDLTGTITDSAVAYEIVTDDDCPVTIPTTLVVPPDGLKLAIAIQP